MVYRHLLSDISRITPTAGSGRGETSHSDLCFPDAFHSLIVLPAKPEERATLPGSQLNPQLTKQIIFRPQNRKARAVDNKIPIKGPPLQPPS